MLRRGLDRIAIHGVQAAAPWVAGRAAFAFAAAGEAEEFARALALVEAGMTLSPSMRHGFAFTWAARGALALGRPGQAAELARKALENPTPDPERGVHAWAHWVLGEAAARGADPAAAGAAHGSALELALGLGMRALEAHCRASLARLAAGAGRAEEAAAEAGRARGVAGEIGLVLEG